MSYILYSNFKNMGNIRTILLAVAIGTSSFCFGQIDDRITTISFVEILDNNKEETEYYFRNNWKVLRDMALEKNYIESYEVLATPWSEDEPYHIILITTYSNKDQYDIREDHFQELIKEKGDLNLLNEKKPDEFRKTLYTKEMVRHWKP